MPSVMGKVSEYLCGSCRKIHDAITVIALCEVTRGEMCREHTSRKKRNRRFYILQDKVWDGKWHIPWSIKQYMWLFPGYV